MSQLTLPMAGESFYGAFSSANRVDDERFSHEEILRAAMMVGRTRRDAMRFGEESWLELMWRVSSVQLSMDLLPAPFGLAKALRRHSHWKRLDASERGSLNYLCGNVVAKLVAERRLGTPLMLHHDVYRTFLRSPLGNKMSRPDFVGWSPWTQTLGPRFSPWITIEAKGRIRLSRNRNGTARAYAKQQARALTHVRGKRVAFHVACWCSERQGRLHAFYEDPEPVDRGMDLNISDDAFAWHYYAPIRDVLERSALADRPAGTVSFAVPGFDLRVALDEELEHYIRSGDNMRDILKLLPRWRRDPPMIGDIPLGPDGIAVIPGEAWRQ